MHIKQNGERNYTEDADINEKYGLKEGETHPLCKSCDYKLSVGASDVSATWCVPPLIYYINNTAVETQAAW